MKARSKNSSNRLAPVRSAAAKNLCSAWELDSTSFAWDNRWGMPLEAAAVGAFAGDDVMRPPTPTIFRQARRWYQLHAFIRNIIHLKLGFYNYGLLGEQLVPRIPHLKSKLRPSSSVRDTRRNARSAWRGTTLTSRSNTQRTVVCLHWELNVMAQPTIPAGPRATVIA